jgi:hypothetical protein
VRCPLCAEGSFSRQILCDVNVRQRPKSLTSAIRTLDMDGLWRNFEAGKAFGTAYMHIGPRRTCDRDGHIGNALTIFGRK